MAKPIRALELHYPMIQFLIILLYYLSLLTEKIFKLLVSAAAGWTLMKYSPTKQSSSLGSRTPVRDVR